MQKTVNGITLEIVRGDISEQSDLDAIVNAANAELRPGAGVAGAIHRKAGPGLAAEGRELAPISPGQAVITGGHDLANRYVIHSLGPVYGRDEPADRLLASCYREALQRADANAVTSVGFPAISTGVFGFPAEPACRIALETVLETLPRLTAVRRIRFVLFSVADRELYEQVLGSLLADT
jgi:O-acetyl-ADP-ribose deacetylase (regulator of RNase III)